MNNFVRAGRRIINIYSFYFLVYSQITSILHIFSACVSTPFLSLLLPVSNYFFLRRVLPASCCCMNDKNILRENKTITHRNPFARSVDINRRSILYAWSTDRGTHEGRKEGRKWDGYHHFRNGCQRGLDNCCFWYIRMADEATTCITFYLPWHHYKNTVHLVAGQYHLYLCNYKPYTMRIIQRNHHTTGIIRV